MSLRIHGSVAADRLAELSELVRSHTTTERLFRAVDALGLVLHDLVAMDEFTNDVVVEVPGGLFLVYDTT
jgi:hypothetical protein